MMPDAPMKMEAAQKYSIGGGGAHGGCLSIPRKLIVKPMVFVCRFVADAAT